MSGETTTPGRAALPWRLTAALLILSAGLHGCGGTVRIKNRLTHGPAIDPLPVSVGIHYPESFLSHVHENTENPLEPWTIPIGEASASILDTCFEGMFERAVRLVDWKPGEPAPPDLDGVIVPKIEAFCFETSPLWASVEYRFTIHSRSGASVATMTARGHGDDVRGPGVWDMFRLPNAASAVEQTVRAAAADMVIGFPAQAGIRSWLTRHGAGRSIRQQMFGRPSGATSMDRAVTNRIAVIPRSVSLPRAGYKPISDSLHDDIVSKLRRAFDSGRVIDEEHFRAQLFPWYERSTMPTTDGAMRELLRRPVVRRRLHQTGVGYLVLVQGSSRIDDWEGPMLAGAGFGAAGMLGVSNRKEATDVSAVVWDVESRRSVAVQASDDGESVMIGLILPLPFFALAEFNAINDLAERLVDHFEAQDESR